MVVGKKNPFICSFEFLGLENDFKINFMWDAGN